MNDDPLHVIYTDMDTIELNSKIKTYITELQETIGMINQSTKSPCLLIFNRVPSQPEVFKHMIEVKKQLKAALPEGALQSINYLPAEVKA